MSNKTNKPNKTDKVEMVSVRTLEYKGEELLVMGAFSHKERKYISIDVKDKVGTPYVICDSNDVYYEKIKTLKVPAGSYGVVGATNV
jgi:hypothetical protein